jgi:predicted molibdopterin-dependent oxidoreductase YjgC
LCDKGRFSHAWVTAEDRLKTPLVLKDGELVPATWGEALQAVASRLQEIKQRSGADAIGFVGSPKVSNEGNYLLQRLARQVIGTNNVDHRDGGDVAALPTGLPALAELMKPQYGPDPKVDVVMLVGVDPEEELPILGLHLKRSVRRGNVQLIVAHPRKIELTRYGGPHLAARPGTEVTLINGLTRMALGLAQNKQPEAAQLVSDATDARLRDVAGVDPAEVRRAAELLAKAKRAVIVYGPEAGRGPAGEQLLTALSNLALVTGHADRLAYVGLDANSQGCRDMGVLPHRLPGHLPVDDEAARKRLDKLWGGAPGSRKAGLSYRQMMDHAGGAIKALYVMGANPASENPAWAANLDKLDFLVVQELYLTETARLADVVLPALGWGETDGSFTNLERRVQRAPEAVKDPTSKAAPDWMILDHLAARLGSNWPYGDARAVLVEIGKATGIYRDLTWDAIGDQGVQWDAAAVRKRPALRRAEQGEVAPVGSWFDLVTGRALFDHGTLVRLTEQLESRTRGATVAIHPDDAAKLGIAEGAPLAVRNGNGTLLLAAKLDATVRPGSVWVAESLPDAPLGALLDGRAAESVEVKPAG